MSKGKKKAKAKAHGASRGVEAADRGKVACLSSLTRGPLSIVLLGIALGLLFWAVGTFDPFHQRVIGVDPVGYYAWLRSPIFDGDLQFANEYRALNPAAIAGDSLVDPDGPRTATGHLPNAFSLGPAILWAPFVLVAHLFAFFAGTADGFSQPYHTAVFVANAFYGIAGAVLTYYALRAWFDATISTLAAVAAWACGPVLYYTYAQEAMSHAPSFFSIALLLFLWARLRLRDGYGPWLVIGAALGFATLVRWQNVTFALLPTIDLLSRGWKRNFLRLAACGATTVLVFLPQMVAWKLLFGSYLTIPQGAGFMDWAHPHFVRLLFSREYGLITWTPLMAIGLVGLFVWPKENRLPFVALAAAFVVQLYVQAVAGNVGWAFGMRRMDNCLPVLAVGFALIMVRLPWRARGHAAIVAFFTVWNVLTAMQYGGLLNSYYVSRGFRELAEEHHTDERLLVRATRLPNGETFDPNTFAAMQIFPKAGAPTFRQMVTDKPRVLLQALRAIATDE